MTTHNPNKEVMYVYKLDTGNHPSTPLPSTTTTTTKKSITRALGALLRRSKTTREKNIHHISSKEDTKEVVVLDQDLARKSCTKIDNARTSNSTIEDVKKQERIYKKTVSLIEEGRKTVSGTEERKLPSRVEVGRRSVENRSDMVMINVGEIAELLQVRVIVTDMPGFMQVHAYRCARQTFDSLEKFSPRQIAFNMKKDFDKVYGPAWHCIVGSSFGSFVTHATGCFLYFSMEKLYILVFKTKVQKNVTNLH